MPEHTPAELFRMDTETYGCWMHPAPFEQFDQLGDRMRVKSREMALAVGAAGPGSYTLAAIYGGAHTATTKAGNRMWWVTLVTEVSSFSVACFSARYDDELDVPGLLPGIRAGALVAVQVLKRPYTVPGRGPRMGWRLEDIWEVR